MQMHLIHLCSLPAVMCCQRLPFPLHTISRILLFVLSPPHRGLSFILAAVAVHLARYQLSSATLSFSHFPNTTRPLLSQPLSFSLPLLFFFFFVPFLSSATLLRREHWVLKPAGAVPEHACVNISITLKVLVRIERRAHVYKVRAFCLFLLL